MNSDKADISIIIPIFNMADTLMQALISLRGGEASLEIILINDGSTDQVNRVVRDFEEEIKDDEKIRFHYISTPNGGRAAARNLGVKMAKGRYISFLDADDSVDIDELMKLFRCATAKDSDLAVGQFIVVGEDNKPFARRRLKQDTTRDDLLKKIALSPLSPVHLNAILLDRRLLLSIPGFDTANINAEDKDLTIRLLRQAQRGTVCDTYHYIYKKHKIGRLPTIKKRLMWLYFRQKLLFSNYDGLFRFSGMFLQLNYDLAKLLYEAILGYKKRIG